METELDGGGAAMYSAAMPPTPPGAVQRNQGTANVGVRRGVKLATLQISEEIIQVIVTTLARIISPCTGMPKDITTRSHMRRLVVHTTAIGSRRLEGAEEAD
ncbi:hypothetical protein PoMZ_00538 [Pyricularia oryzae]|uniref:Uncharacterized protein n=1 Tax=Pyricularia oryzae TaxID=318829 RepID=A0A4P7N4J9_PYROR|nr:hypothetical protein PoMZ_00538 [Pyricularia oryzae]